jgi:magnesium transporter
VRDLGEISVLFAPTFVITVRQGAAGGLQEARQRLEQRPDLLKTGSSAALWAILDDVVDEYAPVVLAVEHDVDEIEATVFAGTVAPTERIYSLRREATGFYRAVHPLLAVISAVERTVPHELRPYLREVRDHLLLVDEGIADERDLLRTVLEANIAVISVGQTRVNVQQNRTIEQLTILATVFLPLTAITSFFGMNFDWMIERVSSFSAFLIFGVGSIVLALALLLSWLKFRMPRADTSTGVGGAAGQSNAVSPAVRAARCI